MPTVNGEQVTVRYGDEIITLDARFDRQDAEIRWLRRVVLVLSTILVFHVLLPGQDMLNFILKLMGF